MSDEECTAAMAVGVLLLVAWYLHSIDALEVLGANLRTFFWGESPPKFK